MYEDPMPGSGPVMQAVEPAVSWPGPAAGTGPGTGSEAGAGGAAAMVPGRAACPAPQVPGTGAGAGAGVDAAELLSALLEVLPGVDVRALAEADLVEVLALAEAGKNALAGLQVRAEVALDAAVRARHEAGGVARAKVGAGVHAQVALARSECPNTGHRLLGMARAVVEGMPHTHLALASGRLTEWRAMLLVRETACLERADRERVDELLMADPAVVEGLGTRQLVARARKLVYAASPKAVADRARKAVGDRHVSLRPAPDTMSILSGLLPVAEGVSVLKALRLEADRLVGVGDGRSRGQIMADTLVERVTGQEVAGQVRLEVQVVMTDRALFEGDAEPAHLPGYGIVPAQVARDLLRRANGLHPEGTGTGTRTRTGTGIQAGRHSGGNHAGGNRADNGGNGGQGVGEDPGSREAVPEPGVAVPDGQGLAWIRRLYTAPGTGELVGMDSRARLFPPGLARFIATRDQTCATPYCDAPLRHNDHVLAWAAGGRTTAGNASGKCADCNYSKEAPGWSAATVPGDRHTTVTTTPTGHAYRSQSPPLPGDSS